MSGFVLAFFFPLSFPPRGRGAPTGGGGRRGGGGRLFSLSPPFLSTRRENEAETRRGAREGDEARGKEAGTEARRGERLR